MLKSFETATNQISATPLLLLVTTVILALLSMTACGGGEEEAAPIADDDYFQSVPYTPVAVVESAAGVPSRQDEVFYDTDGNQLIEIQNLDHLNAIRYDLNGDGVPSDELAYWEAFVGGRPGMGCPEVCIGYELTRDLDFALPNSYQVGEVAEEWVEAAGGGWWPLGTDSEPYSGIFEGNGFHIKHLRLRHSRDFPTGMFGVTDHRSEIRNLDLLAVRSEGGSRAGGLVGDSHGLVFNCGVDGLVSGEIGVGGLLGVNRYTGVVRKSWFRGSVHGFDTVGGAVGINENGWIDSSHVEGSVMGRQDVGGLIGYNTQHGSAQIVFAYTRVLGAANVGGLVGTNEGEIRLAHTAGYIEALDTFGGMIGANELTGKLAYSYSTVLVGPQPETSPGGAVIGLQDGVALSVIWDTIASGKLEAVRLGSDAGIRGELAQTLTRLGDYVDPIGDWNVDIDGDGTPDDPWEFGELTDYPYLRADIDGDGDSSAAEFGRQYKR